MGRARHQRSISSSVRPLVSGTNRHTKRNAAIETVAYKRNVPGAVSALTNDERHPQSRGDEIDSPDNDSLPWVRCPNLLVEFERFRRGVSANVEHREIVYVGLPQKSRGGDVFSFMHFDVVTSQDGGARLAGCLAAVDEENPFAMKIGTNWRLG